MQEELCVQTFVEVRQPGQKQYISPRRGGDIINPSMTYSGDSWGLLRCFGNGTFGTTRGTILGNF